MGHIGQRHMANARQIVGFVSPASFVLVRACKEYFVPVGPTVQLEALVQRSVPKGLTVMTLASTMFPSAIRAKVDCIVTTRV